MKQKFVAYTLMLCVLLIAATPAQAFAATKNTTNYNSNRYILNSNCGFNNNGTALKAATNGNRNHSCNYNTCKSNRASNKNCTTQNCTLNSSNKNCTTNNFKAPSRPANPPTNPPTNPPAPPVVPEPPENNPALNEFEQRVVDLVNKERQAAGLAPLKVSVKLSEAARVKAADMRDNNYFSHNSPVYGSPFDMMRAFGINYTAAGENIAKGQQSPESVMRAWMNSSGHRANILNSGYDQIGVGFVTDGRGTTYWVQQFMR